MSDQPQPQPEEPQRRDLPYWTRGRTVAALVLGALAVFAIGYGTAHLTANRAEPAPDSGQSAPRAGDCVTQKGVPDGRGSARVVDCDAADAQFAVIRTFPAATDEKLCADVPGSRFALAQRATGTGPFNLICVEPLNGTLHWPSE